MLHPVSRCGLAVVLVVALAALVTYKSAEVLRFKADSCLPPVCCRRDWGFLIFGNDLKDAIATFTMQLKEALAGDKVPEAEAAEEANALKTPMGALAHAFRRLQVGTKTACSPHNAWGSSGHD